MPTKNPPIEEPNANPRQSLGTSCTRGAASRVNGVTKSAGSICPRRIGAYFEGEGFPELSLPIEASPSGDNIGAMVALPWAPPDHAPIKPFRAVVWATKLSLRL